VREGKELTSNKTDALSFGGVCENLVLSIDQVAQTTWQEVMTLQYEGEPGLLDCLSAYLQWSPPATGLPPPPVVAHCFSSAQSAAIVRRLEELCADVVECYYRHPHAAAARYIVAVGTRYYALRLENDTLRHTRLESYNDLLKYLAAPMDAYSPVVIDRYALANDILPVIYRNNKAGVVQLYYVEEAASLYIYCIDEHGALFYRRMAKIDIHLVVKQYRRFLAAIGAREFSSLEFGEHLFREVARYILERRRSGLHYPIYITDIDLSHRLAGVAGTERLQTVHYLEYKKLIEERLNQALVALTQDKAANLTG
jgi:adenylate cyclase class 1